MSYGMISILLIGSLRSPPPIRLRRTSPRESVSHDSQVALLPYESCSLATPVQGAEQPVLKVESLQKIASRSFIVPPCRRRYRHIYDGAEGAVPPQWNGTSYLPRAEPSTRPGGVSRSRTEPLAPRAKGPAAPSTLTPVRACQPSGIQSPPPSESRQPIAESSLTIPPVHQPTGTLVKTPGTPHSLQGR